MTLALTLDRAVRHICPEVAKRVPASSVGRLSERKLWDELTCCVLSSQVRYEAAVAATKNIIRFGGVGTSERQDSGLLARLIQALKEPINVDGRSSHYRFADSRARQLVDSRRNLLEADVSLTDIVYSSRSETEKRRILVGLVCGFGPKQASMFLRACGASYDLAILDRHTLRFMQIVQLVSDKRQITYLPIRRYEALESRFGLYAGELGYPIGHVDWAVWVVMKALSGLSK